MVAEEIGTRRWRILNKRHRNVLGIAQYCKSWGCYVLLPGDDCMFSADCLQEIGKFLLTLGRDEEAMP